MEGLAPSSGMIRPYLIDPKKENNLFLKAQRLETKTSVLTSSAFKYADSLTSDF